jgi:hypothetical protein
MNILYLQLKFDTSLPNIYLVIKTRFEIQIEFLKIWTIEE